MRSGAETFSRITKTLPLLRTLKTAATCDKFSQSKMHRTDSNALRPEALDVKPSRRAVTVCSIALPSIADALLFF
jgi:hypothetical protein